MTYYYPTLFSLISFSFSFYLCTIFTLFLFLNTVTDIKETATAVNFTLMKLIALQDTGGEESEELRPSIGKFLIKS